MPRHSPDGIRSRPDRPIDPHFTKDNEVLSYLSDQELEPGSVVTIKSVGPFEGPVTLEKDNEHIVIGNTLSKIIYAEILEGTNA